MKLWAIIIPAICCAILWGCADSGTDLFPETGIVGQVYDISWPGPVPEGWTPQPMERVVTVQVLTLQSNVVAEAKTDAKGKFLIPVVAGRYNLLVKESPVPTQTGPFDVRTGERAAAVAHYDVGMR